MDQDVEMERGKIERRDNIVGEREKGWKRDACR